MLQAQDHSPQAYYGTQPSESTWDTMLNTKVTKQGHNEGFILHPPQYRDFPEALYWPIHCAVTYLCYSDRIKATDKEATQAK